MMLDALDQRAVSRAVAMIPPLQTAAIMKTLELHVKPFDLSMGLLNPEE
jgi:hypothetical protein